MTSGAACSATPKLNEKLMVAVYHHIKANPGQWRQESWACNTSMCVAGWALTVSGVAWDQAHYTAAGDSWWLPNDFREDSIGARATALLGLTSWQAQRLFYGLDTSLASLRKVMTDILGYDPDGVSPDEDLMLTAKLAAHEYYG